MAKKKADTPINEMTVEELTARLERDRETLFRKKFENATAPLKNTRTIRALRRDIARALTFLKQKGVSR